MLNAYERGKKLLCGDYSQYTPTGKSYFVKAGRWHTSPQVGDIVYFYYKNLQRVGHVGSAIVSEVGKKSFKIRTIEGNTSGNAGERNGGCVASHTYEYLLSEVGGQNKINGFGRPLFGSETCTVYEWMDVLQQELGYIEKASRKDLNSKEANAGSANFTKYGEWYGNNGAYWCQQFISWCAYEACRIHMENTQSGWEQQKDGTWKYKCYGAYLCDEWEEIATKAGIQWFVFDGSGKMVTGWFHNEENDWYYLNPADGAMLAGQWFVVADKWYYATKSGEIARNVYVKDKKGWCWCSDTGEWDETYTEEPDLQHYGAAE